MHGGGFVGGDKRFDPLEDFSERLTMRGYAVFSISYRLTGDYWEWDSGRAVLDAVEDLRAAIRYVRKNAELYRLDTDKIIASGSSAGAITAL